MTFTKNTIGILATSLALTLSAPVFSNAPDHQEAKANDIVDTAVAAKNFGTLIAAVQAAGLEDVLRSDGPFTVLAPNDEAFAKLPAQTLQQLLLPRNREALKSILLYHVIPGRVTAAQAVAAQKAETASGVMVSFAIESGRLAVNGKRVLANDIDATNGVIHVIDEVLLPANLPALQPAGDLVIGIYRGHLSGDEQAMLRLTGDEGLKISQISGEGGAKDAGLMADDVMLLIDGKPATRKGLAEAKERAGAGGTIEIVIARTVTVEVGADH